MLYNIFSDKYMVTDLLKFGTMFIVSRLLSQQNLDDNEWTISSIYMLCGLVTYHLLIKNNVKYKLQNQQMNDVLDDWLKFGTTLVVARVLSNASLTNYNWQMGTIYTILGLNAYTIIIKNLVPTNNFSSPIKDIINGSLKWGTMLIVNRLLSGDSLDNEQWIVSSLYTLLGFAAYEIGIKKLFKI